MLFCGGRYDNLSSVAVGNTISLQFLGNFSDIALSPTNLI